MFEGSQIGRERIKKGLVKLKEGSGFCSERWDDGKVTEQREVGDKASSWKFRSPQGEGEGTHHAARRTGDSVQD